MHMLVEADDRHRMRWWAGIGRRGRVRPRRACAHAHELIERRGDVERRSSAPVVYCAACSEQGNTCHDSGQPVQQRADTESHGAPPSPTELAVGVTLSGGGRAGGWRGADACGPRPSVINRLRISAHHWRLWRDVI